MGYYIILFILVIFFFGWHNLRHPDPKKGYSYAENTSEFIRILKIFVVFILIKKALSWFYKRNNDE